MSSPESTSHGSGGYEKKDTSARGILIVALISVVIVVLSVILTNELFIATREELVDEMVLKPESAALRDLRAREAAVLFSYEVLDAEKGVYRIPIDRAMKLMAEEAYAQQPLQK
ncbi:MAG TPA: hypothetical protein VF398_04725 [bacterium]|jgi:hypothetical protein